MNAEPLLRRWPLMRLSGLTVPGLLWPFLQDSNTLTSAGCVCTCCTLHCCTKLSPLHQIIYQKQGNLGDMHSHFEGLGATVPGTGTLCSESSEATATKCRSVGRLSAPGFCGGSAASAAVSASCRTGCHCGIGSCKFTYATKLLIKRLALLRGTAGAGRLQNLIV